MANPVVLITGGAKRIGAEITRHLHRHNFNIVLHYNNSKPEAENLATLLNSTRKNSVFTISENLYNTDHLETLAARAIQQWGRVDVLINNASSFYPTPLGSATEQDWDHLLASNLKAPFFLAQALANELTQHNGCIINIADIYAERPLKDHAIYCIAKAGNVMLTKSLALELAPQVRVNGIAPGAILWPESTPGGHHSHQEILAKIPANKLGEPSDIAAAVLFLIQNSPYMSGHILTIDGGRNLQI